jgi:CHAD domain-containing protein
MTDPATTLEVERKFRVHGLYRLPDLVATGAVAAAEDTGVVELDATYYDTDDLRLAREGITLRRRIGGADEGWHLKIPAGLGTSGAVAREELRLPLDASDGEEPPAGLATLVGAIVRSDALRPVATLRTERRSILLTPHPVAGRAAEPVPGSAGEGDGDGVEAEVGAGDPAVSGRDGAAAAAPAEPLLVLTDDVVSVLDSDGSMAARFRELELEDLPDADPQAAGLAADAVSHALVAAGAIAGEFVSKAVRALGPFAAAPPEVPVPDEVDPSSPARDAIRAHLARHTRALRLADLAVRRDLPDAVHQARVACRRLRSGLKVFGPLLDQAWAEGLREELGWAAGELGDYRDTEVLLERLEEHLGRLPETVDIAAARAHVETELTARLAAARERAIALTESKRYLDLHARLVTAAADPVTNEDADCACAEVLPPHVVKAWKKLARESAKLLADEVAIPGGAPDDEWHETRITAKKARYAVEACAPVFGPEAAAFGKQLARVTELLGEHQDATIAGERIHDLVREGDPSAEAAFALGALLAVERECVLASRTAYAQVWPEVRGRRWRRWLGA